MRSLYYLLFFSLSACFNGPGLFDQELDDQGVLVDGTTVGGIVTGQISAGSSVPQTLAAAANSAISGSSVTFPPGALSIDTSVTIEQGAAFANNGSALELGVSTAFASGGPAVVVLPGESIDADNPFSIQIPRDGAALALLNSDNLVVLYKKQKASEGKTYLGYITSDQLTVTEGFVSFNTSHFGTFQVAISDEKLTESKEVVTETAILTKAVEDTLEPISWSIASLSFDESDREVTLSVSVSGFGSLSHCAFEIFEQQGSTSTQRNTATAAQLSNLDNGSSADSVFTLTNSSAHTLWGQAVCTDSQGRSEASPYSSELSVAAEEEEEDEEETLAFTGGWALSDPPTGREVSTANTDVDVTLECEPNAALQVEGSGLDMSSGPTSMTCPSSGSLTIHVGYTTTATNVDVNMLDSDGGKYMRVYQGEEYIETVIHKMPSGMSMSLISTVAQLQAVNLTSGYYVLTADINLSGVANWTPLDIHPTTDWHFSGDMHSIENMNIDIDASTAVQTNKGLLGYVQVHSGEYFTFGQVHVDGSIQRVNTNQYNITRVGMVAGNLDCNTGVVCEIFQVEVDGTITIDDVGVGTNSIIGGMFGAGDGLQGAEYDIDIIVDVQGDQVGGVVGALGDFYTASIDSIFITSTSDIQGEDQTGGIYGYCDGSSTVDYAFSAAQVNGMHKVGGLGGYSIQCDHSSSAATGDVSLSGDNGGGLVGYATTSSFNDVYAEGDVTGTGSQFYGGLIGYFVGTSSSTINRAFASGSVSGSVSTCGGLFGYTNDEVGLTNIFAAQASAPTCSSNNGQVAGTIFDSGTGTTFDSAWDSVHYMASGGSCSAGAHNPTGGECTRINSNAVDDESDTFYSSASWLFDGNPWSGISSGLPEFEWGQ